MLHTYTGIPHPRVDVADTRGICLKYAQGQKS